MRAMVVAAVSAATVWAAVGTAASVGASERQLDAHQHGTGHLNVVLENNTLWIELEAPGADIVGFEHHAETDADRAAVDDAMAALREPETLFVLPSEARCTPSDATVELESGGDADEAEHGHAHAEDGKSHDHEDAHAAHGAFVAEYAFTCERPQYLDGIAFPYFERFPRAEKLQVNAVINDRQSRYEVVREAPRLGFNGS